MSKEADATNASVHTVPTSLIGQRFEQMCRERAGAVAILDLSSGRAIAFDELLDQSAAIRQTLADLGVAAGACVVSLIGNRPLFFPLVVAAMDLGAALLPLGDVTDSEAAALIDAAV